MDTTPFFSLPEGGEKEARWPAVRCSRACLFASLLLHVVVFIVQGTPTLSRHLLPQGRQWAAPEHASASSLEDASASSLDAPDAPRDGAFLVSTSVEMGRVGNNLISIHELRALAEVSRRTLVLADPLSCRGAGGDQWQLAPEARGAPRSVHAYWAPSLEQPYVALADWDAGAAGCTRANSVWLAQSPRLAEWFPANALSVGGNASVCGLVDVPVVDGLPLDTRGEGATRELLRFAELPEVLSGPIHATYFNPGFRGWVDSYRTSGFLFERLQSLDAARCVFLGNNFLSVNWERQPRAFVRAVRHLLPARAFSDAALDFLAKHGLAGGGARGTPRGCPLGAAAAPARLTRAAVAAAARGERLPGGWDGDSGGVPFLGLHVRLGDFKASPLFSGLGKACNEDATHLPRVVRTVLSQHPHISTLVLATDEPGEPCIVNLLRAAAEGRLTPDARSVTLIPLAGSFPHLLMGSCGASLTDQEVLGHAAAFMGDVKSSFSQAIHQIRTLRCGTLANTTTWV